jgi:hypothetical protein
MSNDLALLTQAEQMLATVDRPDDALKLADMAEAARVYARKAELGTSAVNHATAIKVRALKRMAELVDEGQQSGAIATAGGDRQSIVASQDNGPVTLTDLGITRQRLHEARKLETVDDGALAELVEEANEAGREISVAEVTRPAFLNIHRSQSNEWYTPAPYITSARSVMGGIDVDPASNPLANKTINAATFYSADDNGLGRPWRGRVWLNPPWGREQGEFIASLVEQFGEGIVTQAVVLVNAHATETDWFRPMWDHTLCFTDHRINFHNGGGGPGTGSTHGSVFIYLGPNEGAFAREFQQWGYVVRRVDA